MIEWQNGNIYECIDIRIEFGTVQIDDSRCMARVF